MAAAAGSAPPIDTAGGLPLTTERSPTMKANAPTKWLFAFERDGRLQRVTVRPLIGYLFYGLRTGACARLGPGARSVALSSAAHDSSCGSLMACAGRALLSRERLKRGLLSSK